MNEDEENEQSGGWKIEEAGGKYPNRKSYVASTQRVFGSQ